MSQCVCSIGPDVDQGSPMLGTFPCSYYSELLASGQVLGSAWGLTSNPCGGLIHMSMEWRKHLTFVKSRYL